MNNNNFGNLTKKINAKRMTSPNIITHIDTKYFGLVAAILEQAEIDLKIAIKRNDKRDIVALKKWFLSEWGQLLSGNNGELIIRRIERECGVSQQKG